MEPYKYEPIDLDERSFRLIRLFKGGQGPIRCEIFHAWLDDTKDGMEYEALSYTWGDTHRPYDIEISGKTLPITKNLYLALEHLRHPEEDRILWIDAICIDQDNVGERGHQVRQMPSTYERAVRVIIWLGRSTSETDVVFDHMNRLETQALGHPCNNWKTSDERWQLLWSNAALSLKIEQKNPESPLEGFRELLLRPWFRRAWIIQEVAKARAAKVMCGAKSVSARIFAVTPSLVGATPDPHCQSILDIMPGPSRNSSWWTEDQNLRTLLYKFRESQASDQRDVIYALLGILSDRLHDNIPIPNYEMSLDQLRFDTIVYLLHLPVVTTISMTDLPQWSFMTFQDNILLLETRMLQWAAKNGKISLVKLLLDLGKTDINLKDQLEQTPLLCAVNDEQKAVVKLFIDTGKIDINLQNAHGATPLLWAAQTGNEAVVRLLLETEKIDINLQDVHGATPLLWAAQIGDEAVVRLLLNTGKVEVDSEDQIGRTPLFWASEGWA